MAEFAEQIEAYEKAMVELNIIEAQKQQAAKAKQKAFDKMADSLKRQLRYGENVTGFDDAKLNILGWSARRPKSSALPGQVIGLKAIEQGSDFVTLSWKGPQEGSKPAAYQILREMDKAPNGLMQVWQ